MMYLHGMLQTSTLRSEHDLFLKKLNIRLICPNLPSSGWFDYQDGCKIVDAIKDLEDILDFIEEVKSLPIIGESGGGPYAAALAAKRPERVKKLCLMCSLLPYQYIPSVSSLPLQFSFVMYFSCHSPRLWNSVSKVIAKKAKKDMSSFWDLVSRCFEGIDDSKTRISKMTNTFQKKNFLWSREEQNFEKSLREKL